MPSTLHEPRLPSTLQLPTALLLRLQAMARRRASNDDAADAVQEALLSYWQHGCVWHEGRLVLELKSRLRNQRRARATRRQREHEYSTWHDLCQGGDDDDVR